MTDEGVPPAMAATTLFTFAEIEFMLRSAAKADSAGVEAVRRRLDLPADAADVTAAAGVASLLARELCTEHDGDVKSGPLVTATVAALSTVHTLSEAAGRIDARPVVAHLLTGSAARLVWYPGSFGLFGAEVIDPAEPLARPLERFVGRCLDGASEGVVAIRSAPVGGGSEVGVAVGRTASGDWLLSDTAANPDQAQPVSRAEITGRLDVLFGSPAGV